MYFGVYLWLQNVTRLNSTSAEGLEAVHAAVKRKADDDQRSDVEKKYLKGELFFFPEN